MPISNDMITIIKEVTQMDDGLIELRFNLECLSIRKSTAVILRDMLTRGLSAPDWWVGDTKGWARLMSILKLLCDVGLTSEAEAVTYLLYTSDVSREELDKLLKVTNIALH